MKLQIHFEEVNVFKDGFSSSFTCVNNSYWKYLKLPVGTVFFRLPGSVDFVDCMILYTVYMYI